MNGLVLERGRIKDLFAYMKSLPIAHRHRLPGLDKGRAGVILAGTLTVMRILNFFKSFQMTVSYSDLLEGVLIDYLQGVKDE